MPWHRRCSRRFRIRFWAGKVAGRFFHCTCFCGFVVCSHLGRQGVLSQAAPLTFRRSRPPTAAAELRALGTVKHVEHATIQFFQPRGLPTMKVKLVALTALVALTSNIANANEPIVVNQAVTEKEALTAQQAWCAALLDINAAYEKDGKVAARALAEKVIDSAYAYQMGAVLFKPTLTVNPQTFRPTRAGALSYFVGGDPSFPADTGFALKGWKKCEPVTSAIFLDGNSAITMGKVHFTDKNGKVTTVDKTWGYVKDDAGNLRINLHHSSLEYQPK